MPTCPSTQAAAGSSSRDAEHTVGIGHLAHEEPEGPYGFQMGGNQIPKSHLEGLFSRKLLAPTG